VVEGGDLLGQIDRVVLGDEGDAGAEAQRPGDGRRLAEGDERVEGAAVLGGKFAARRVRGGPLDGDVRVLRQVEPGEAALFQLTGEAGGGDRLVGEEDGDGDAHGGPFDAYDLGAALSGVDGRGDAPISTGRTPTCPYRLVGHRRRVTETGRWHALGVPQPPPQRLSGGPSAAAP
jgi:hypothetical protein